MKYVMTTARIRFYWSRCNLVSTFLQPAPRGHERNSIFCQLAKNRCCVEVSQDFSMYSVLEFVQERSVAVVPDSWVERTCEGHFCYWPPKNKQKLIQRGSLPDKALWKKLEVRVFKSSVDYKTAHQLMRKAENTSCLEESDGSGKKLREKRPPSRYLCYTSASEDDSFQPTKGPKVQARSPPRLSDFLAQTRCALYQDMERGLDMAREPASLPNWSEIPVVVGRELEMAQRPPIQPERPPQRDNFQMHVLMKLDQLLQKQEEQSLLLKQLINARSEVPMDMEFVTVDDMEGFNKIEIKLKDEEEERKMVRYLATLGGHSLGDSVRRTMRTIASSRIWASFSLKGRKGKISLQNLTIYRVIMKAVMRSQPGSNAADIEAHIAETLKHAPGIARRKGNPLANSDPVESESPSYNFFTST
ncbi:uncharacterized protein [Hoplias malabaricus]|uniref:uncharacterized protein isoform X1 n=1 Tax=Hoplias malabaricus TaxID=27720 RepID=UPI00346183D9